MRLHNASRAVLSLNSSLFGTVTGCDCPKVGWRSGCSRKMDARYRDCAQVVPQSFSALAFSSFSRRLSPIPTSTTPHARADSDADSFTPHCCCQSWDFPGSDGGNQTGAHFHFRLPSVVHVICRPCRARVRPSRSAGLIQMIGLIIGAAVLMDVGSDSWAGEPNVITNANWSYGSAWDVEAQSTQIRYRQ
ncbi:hypothetical protein BJV78DRAFT_723793 [Lactifluus subvellereus]|nr:hypothetical protein BJV78DRAFT_723793 [Lactifluus subvellereus]